MRQELMLLNRLCTYLSLLDVFQILHCTLVQKGSKSGIISATILKYHYNKVFTLQNKPP